MNNITRRDLLRSVPAVAVTAAVMQTAHETNAESHDWLVLECKWIEKNIEGLRVKLRSYNGNVPGELIKAYPGQTLRIRLKNSLPPVDSTGWDGSHNVPHMFDSTNLHLHGLDIIPHLFEPVGTSDPLSKMIDVMPGESYDYEFRIPDDQPPGLCWYHPHHHGSTAVQAVSGMAGPLITYGDIDEVPEIKAARDLLLVVNDIGLFPSEENPDIWTYSPK